MKAEHRKELQTNVLADRMGRFMENVRRKPRGKTVLIWVLVIVALIAAIFYVLWRNAAQRTQSEQWLLLNTGSQQAIEKIVKEYPNYQQAKVGRFQKNWAYLWDYDASLKEGGVFYGGIANLKTSPALPDGGPIALYTVAEAAKEYLRLIEETEDNPLLRAEAMYNLAVAQEALSIQEIDQLKSAKKTLTDLVQDEKLKDTVHAKMAKKRLDAVYNNEEAFVQMRDFYAAFSPKGPELKK